MRIVAGLGVIGIVLLAIAVWNERRMQRHRQPGVSYRDVTFRKDGGWRRADLFTDEGLRYQRRASTFGVAGIGLVIAALVVWGISRR